MKYLKSPHDVIFVKIMKKKTLFVQDNKIDFDDTDTIEGDYKYWQKEWDYKPSTREEFDEMYKKTAEQLNKLSAL